jgi:hypothetical protein
VAAQARRASACEGRTRVSAGPATDALGELYELAHQGFVPLAAEQLAKAESLLEDAGAR